MIESKLKLGKGAAFVKSHLRLLPQCDEIWEADIREAPSPKGINAMLWQGLVISHDGRLLNERMFEEPATMNDMATLLADAMMRSFDGNPRRPKTLRIRKRLEWLELLPHLEQLGIRIVSAPRLAKWDRIFDDFCRKVLKPGSPPDQAAIAQFYPTLFAFIGRKGHIEIGDREGFGFVARASNRHGVVFEAREAKTLAEAMSALEDGLADRLENGSLES